MTSTKRTNLIRALNGDADSDAICASIANQRLAPMIATCASAHPFARTVAAMSSGLPSLLDTPDCVPSAVRLIVQRALETEKNSEVLWECAQSAPVTLANDDAHQLMAAIKNQQCPPIAVALIEPSDESAALLADSHTIAHVICQWGRSRPDDPTWWTTHVSASTLNRLTAHLLKSELHAGRCLPWLPTHIAHTIATSHTKSNDAIDIARDAFARASPAAHALHADVIQIITTHPRAGNPGPLAALAHAMSSDALWEQVCAMLDDQPDHAARVVVRLPWTAIAPVVQGAIIRLARQSSLCAAIAAARGFVHGEPGNERTAVAFFAALDPRVWDDLDGDVQLQWLRTLSHDHVKLAVRSLGLRPMILAAATRFTNDLVEFARLHAADESELRIALFPVALKRLSIAEVYPLLSAMSVIHGDPVTVFSVACGRSDCRSLSASVPPHSLESPADLAVAIVLQRSANFEMKRMPIGERVRMLADALHERTHADLASLSALLTDDARDGLYPDMETIVPRIAAPGCEQSLRSAITSMTSLPPGTSLPALHAIADLDRTWERDDRVAAASALMRMLRQHGDLALAIADSLDNDVRDAFLPHVDSPALANVLRDLVRSDPFVAHCVAHVPASRRWIAVIDGLLESSSDHAFSMWHALPDDVRESMLNEAAMHVPALADERNVHDAHAAWRVLAMQSPLAALALSTFAVTQEDDYDERMRRFASCHFVVRSLRSFMPLLRKDLQALLLRHPVIHASLADIACDAHCGKRPMSLSGRLR